MDENPLVCYGHVERMADDRVVKIYGNAMEGIRRREVDRGRYGWIQ